MTAIADPLPVSPTVVTAALAACVGLPGSEIAMIVAATAETLATVPGHAALGYAVDGQSGAVFAPGAPLPPARPLFASLRIPVELDVLDLLSTLAGNGWRVERSARLVPALDHSLPVIRARPLDLAGIPPLPAETDGAGVLLGVVDFGCDFAHPAFLRADGTTRLEFLWDQNAPAPAGAAIPGAVRERAAIDAALPSADPYQALGYWPDANAYAPSASRRDQIVHGTHVLGVAAGRGTAACPAGVAPGATLAFVHLRPGALVSAGDPADVFDGVCAIFGRADALGLPAVVNLSLGSNIGSHDGNTLYDRALDALLAKPGRAIVVAAGNERQSRLNVDGTVAAGSPTLLRWRFEPGDRTANTARIFADTVGRRPALTCVVRQDGQELGVPMDGAPTGVPPRGVIYSGLAPGAGAEPVQHIEVRLRPSGVAETVVIELSTDSATPVAFDAWIDRDDRQDASQSSWDLPEPLTRSTLVGTACGRRTLCVGAFDHQQPTYLAAPFSAEGLTRDSRRKPDLCAPGVAILAAGAYGGRTRPDSPWQKPTAVRMSGTSVAAPHVAGVQALMLQRAPALTAEQGAAILRQTSRLEPSYADADWHPQCGNGRVDAAAALARLFA